MMLPAPSTASEAGHGRAPAWLRLSSTTLVAVLAFLSAGLLLFWVPGPGFGEGHEAVAVARALAAGRGYANPYSTDPAGATGPTAHLPPLFPLFLAGLFWLFGFTPAAITLACGACVAVHALHALLLVRASSLFFASDRPGIWAALFSILTPALTVLPQWEAIYAATGLMIFTVSSDRWLRRHGLDTPCAAKCGTAAGILALLNSTTVTVTGTWILWRLLRTPASLAHRLKFLALTGLFALLSLTPWALRNWLALGAPVLFRSNLGLELAVSNNPWAAPSQVQNFREPAVWQMHPTHSPLAREELKRRGEIAYNREKLRQALAWIRENKTAFLKLSLMRALQFWWPVYEQSRLHVLAVRLVTVLGFAGMLLMLVHRRPALSFFAAALLGYSLIYYFIHVSTRYRFPIMWIHLLAAGYLLDHVTHSLRNRCRGGSSVVS